MQHLTAIDAGFLQMETSQTPMHLASVHMLQLPPGYQGDFPEVFKRHIQSRLHLASMLTRKLVTMPLDLANPVWVQDDAIDIDYHVRRLSLPSPGTHAQLMGVVGRLHSIIMDRSRPLWEIALIEGVQGGGYAMYLKLHHAGLDGLAGQRLIEALFDVTSTPRVVAPPKGRSRAASTSTRSLFLASLGNAASQTLRLVRNLPETTRMVLGMLRGMRAATGEANPPKKRRFFFGPPRVSFNTTVTNQRLFAACSMPIADMKVITKACGCTLNDVVMAVAAGALRRYLLRKDDLPDRSLLALMPISIRAPGDMEMSNRVSAARCDLHTDIEDPIERLQAVRRSTADIKRNLENTRKGTPTDFPSIGVPWLLPSAVALIGKLHLADRLPPIANVVVSNVAVSPTSLYVAGAKVTSYWPILVLMHGMGLGLATHSYAGSMEWGVIGCRQSLPDVDDFAADLMTSFAELLAAVVADEATRTAVAPPTGKPAARKASARRAAPAKAAAGKAVTTQTKGKIGANANAKASTTGDSAVAVSDARKSRRVSAKKAATRPTRSTVAAGAQRPKATRARETTA
ncbi:MAG: wax ester/triacylglycerol synthase family O-acyltransferase [Betaproteobacteria bacterium]